MADVQIKFDSESRQARRDIKQIEEELKNLGVEGISTKKSLSEIGSGLQEAERDVKTGAAGIIQLTKDIGNAFKVALFDVPVGFAKETFRIFGRQKPPPFISDLQAELRSLNITIESTTAGIESASRPIAFLDTVLESLENVFAKTSASTEFFQARLQSLQPELDRVNARLATKRAEYVALVRDGTDPADTSLRQVTASIEILEGKSKDLTREIAATPKEHRRC